jgi:hypothetical protein
METTARNPISERLVTPLDDPEPGVRRAARQLRLDLGWKVVVSGGHLCVELDEHLTGLVVPAEPTALLLAGLAALGVSGVAIGALHRDQAGCVLFGASGPAPGPEIPDGVSVLRPGAPVALPPSITLRGRLDWLTPAPTSAAALPSVHLLAYLLGNGVDPLGERLSA